MPAPPATVSPTNPTRQSTGSIPLYSARPPQTPPSIFSVPLRRSCGRTVGWSGEGVENGADVMPEACSAPGAALTREVPDPSLVPGSGWRVGAADDRRSEDRHLGLL